jgi:hypothetical protein
MVVVRSGATYLLWKKSSLAFFVQGRRKILRRTMRSVVLTETATAPQTDPAVVETAAATNRERRKPAGRWRRQECRKGGQPLVVGQKFQTACNVFLGFKAGDELGV